MPFFSREVEPTRRAFYHLLCLTFLFFRVFESRVVIFSARAFELAKLEWFRIALRPFSNL